MKVKTYGSIYIGTYEVSLRIYEVKSKEKKLRVLDDLRKPVSVAHDIYRNGMISDETINTIIDALTDMKQALDEYRIDFYQAYVGYAVGKASNFLLLADQIRLRCGLFVKMMTNSEHRFYNYEALAALPVFQDMIGKSALLADIGGSSIQLTLFRDGKLLTTQHILFGASAVRENLLSLAQKADAREQVYEMIVKETDTFFNMYLKDRKPEYLILLNDNFSNVLSLFDVRADAFNKAVEKKKTVDFLKHIGSDNFFRNTFEKFGVEDPDEMVLPFLLLYQALISQTDCKMISNPGISIHDGITLQMLYNTGTIKSSHDFDQDVISAAYFTAERFGSYMAHIRMMDKISAAIYDAVAKKSGLTKRCRLLTRVVAILHDCGKYISLSSAPESSYTIIMSSEFLGITHEERKLIALVIRYNHEKEITYDDLKDDLSEEDYVVFLKLLAILRICNALDSSHKQKFKDMTIRLRNDTLYITVASEQPLNLEKEYFREKGQFFEVVFGIRPQIRDRKEF
ncbi:MAG: HD domain-containing protein [Lachnospiraceae bacterium]|nr:HD domain-containing protein [Lachnospiraceae bacterium]